VDSRSIETYSWIQGSVLLNAAKANGLEANFWKNSDRGFMSIIEIAPPVGSILYASWKIAL
jgi:hypothetical protein